jgi:murein L,D-transpeptidase YcbB/YkuD
VMWGLPWQNKQYESPTSVVQQTLPPANQERSVVMEAVQKEAESTTVELTTQQVNKTLAQPQQSLEQTLVSTPTTEQGAAAMGGVASAGADHSEVTLAKETVEMDSVWLSEQHGLSWSGLAALWQDENNANAIQAACDGQSRTGYACLHAQGSWARVERLGLPVILVLHDQGDRQVLLQGLKDRQLLLGAGDQPQAFERQELESKWLGKYLVAWPQAPDWPNQIRRGQSGAAVDIVMRMASQASPAWTGAGVFDAGFESWLMNFQQQHALTADGIIGPETLLYLMAPTIKQPRL